MAPSHYLNQCWNIVNWSIGNKLKQNLYRKLYMITQENAFENVVCKMAAILSRLQHVNSFRIGSRPHFVLDGSQTSRIRPYLYGNRHAILFIFSLVEYFARSSHYLGYPHGLYDVMAMGLLPDTQNCGCACAGNAGNVFPVTAGKRSRHASRHVRHARAVMHAGIAK